MSDEDLIKQVIDGDREAFSLIVDRYKDRIFNTAYRFTCDYEECDDLCQEIFIAMYRNARTFNFKSKLSTWIYRISVNKCIDWKRKNKNRICTHVSLQSEHEDHNTLIEKLYNTQHSPEDEYILSEEALIVKNAVDELTDKYRIPIILYHFQGLRCREISEILKINKRTVETRIYRAKQMLKKKLWEKKIGGEIYELQTD